MTSLWFNTLEFLADVWLVEGTFEYKKQVLQDGNYFCFYILDDHDLQDEAHEVNSSILPLKDLHLFSIL